MMRDERAIQTEELSRVRTRLAESVLTFCRANQQFRLTDLLAFMQGHGDHGAPDSPSRILRDLRQRGKLSYTVVNRRASLYRIDWVQGDGRLF